MEGIKTVDTSLRPCIDHNENHLVKDPELCFIGYGEDESSHPEKNELSKKWKPTDEDISEFLSNNTYWDSVENGAFIHEIMEKYFVDGELNGVDFTDKHSALETLRSILHSVNHNRPALWEWLENSDGLLGSPDDMDFVPATENTNSQRESNGSSSLGILSYSDMSSLSCTSFEGVKTNGQMKSKDCMDTTELIGEIEELHHQNKRLIEERSRLAKQIAQTEDSNNQLVHENDELMKKVQTLQNLLDKLKGNEKDHEEAELALHRLEDVNKQLQNNLNKEERENKEISEQLRESNHLLLLSQTDVDNLRQQMQELAETLKESEATICNLKEQYDSCLQELKEKTTLLEEKEKFIRNLEEVAQSLKEQKQALELQLSHAEEEIASLQHTAKKEPALEHESELVTLTCSHSDSSTSLEPPCQSTPLPLTKISLCAEMRDAMTPESRGPFCGKHIFPEALYRETNNPISPLTNRKKTFFSPRVRKRRACLRCHFYRKSYSHEEKRAKLVDGFTDDDYDLFDAELNADGQLEKRESISEEANCGGSRDIQRTLARMKGGLHRLNADAAALISSYSGTGNHSEPKITVIAADTSSSSKNIDTNDDILGEHISAELKVLKDELSKTNAILCTLSRGQQFVLSMPSFLQDPHTIKEHRKHYQSDLLPAPDCKRHSWMKERATSVSQKSTPLHRTRSLTRSCPNLPNQWHFATRGTQTEELQSQSGSPDLPRNRSASFVAAIRKGQVAEDTHETGSRAESDATRDSELSLPERTIVERKHHKHSHVRIASTDSESERRDKTSDDEDEGRQAARKRRRSFTSGTYGLAFDHEEDEDAEAQRQIAAVHAVATACLAKQSPETSKVASEQSKELKNKFLMPEMESSETESAKDSANGSMESETAEPPPSGEEQQALASNFFRKSFLLKPDQLTSKEIEEKFGLLSLAFKTDKFTLGKRLELQKRQRDTAEQNIEEEIKKMKDVLVKLNQQCPDIQTRDLLTDLQQRIEIVHLTTSRMSSRSEVYGAVQQEERMNHAFEVMVTYVEQLKRLYEKEHHELEDTRRLLLENRLLHEPAGGDLFLDDNKRTLRSLSSSGKPGARRRASVAVFHRPSLQEKGKPLITSSIPTGVLVEPRPRHVVGVNKDETLGTISIPSSTPELETGLVPITPSTQLTEDSHKSCDNLGGNRQPETNMEVIKGAESTIAEVEDTTLKEAVKSEETHAKEESSPKHSDISTVKFVRSTILQKAIIGGQRLFNYIPDEFPWDFNSVVRVLRYGLASILVFGAIVTLVSGILPSKSSACAGQLSPSHYSFQEIIEQFFQPHLSFHNKNKPV